MRRRNWALLVLCVVGATFFTLSRTVWGPPSKAIAAEASVGADSGSPACGEPSDAQQRYIANQPRHWRYVILKH